MAPRAVAALASSHDACSISMARTFRADVQKRGRKVVQFDTYRAHQPVTVLAAACCRGQCRGRRSLEVLRCEHTWPATPEHVRDARACVAELAARAGASSEMLDGVRLAVSEAVANVVLHGYRDRARGSVTVAAEAGDEHLLVTVSDEGVGFSPRTDSPGAGLGLPLIAEVAESMSVSNRRGGHGTVLSMTFELPQPVAA